jgi:exopolysaccharide biosynthesis polyprenyl glycosylphosphotransferase
MSTAVQLGNESEASRVALDPDTAARAAAPWAVAPPTRRPLSMVTAEIREQHRSHFTKRALDVIGSVLGLLLLSPVFLLVAVAVKATSRGPALFVQKRCGQGGRLFDFYKFRTMTVDAEERKADLEHLNELRGPAFKIRRDPRITPVGMILRKLSLDELPQLWNVLKGDMSLVGPRPGPVDEVERYTSQEVQRLSVVPGITGLWQVSGRSALSDFDARLRLDLEYARRSSLWLDVKILVKTIFVVISTHGAE